MLDILCLGSCVERGDRQRRGGGRCEKYCGYNGHVEATGVERDTVTMVSCSGRLDKVRLGSQHRHLSPRRARVQASSPNAGLALTQICMPQQAGVTPIRRVREPCFWRGGCHAHRRGHQLPAGGEPAATLVDTVRWTLRARAEYRHQTPAPKANWTRRRPCPHPSRGANAVPGDQALVSSSGAHARLKELLEARR